MFNRFLAFLKNNLFRFIAFILVFFCIFTSFSTINKKKASANPLAIPVSYGLYEVVVYLLGAIGISGVVSGLSEIEYSYLVRHMVKWVSEDGRITPYLLYDATKCILLGRDLQKYCPDFVKDFIKECATVNGSSYSIPQEIEFNKTFSYNLHQPSTSGFVTECFYFTNNSLESIFVKFNVSSNAYYDWQDFNLKECLSGFKYSLGINIPAGTKLTAFVRADSRKIPGVIFALYNISTGQLLSPQDTALDYFNCNSAGDYAWRLFGSASFQAGKFDITAIPSKLNVDLIGSVCVDGVINFPKVDEGIGEDVLPYLDADSVTISNANVNANDLVAENADAIDVANELGYTGTLDLSNALTNEIDIDKADTKEIELPGEDNINKDDFSTPKKIKLNFTPLYLNLKDKFPFCLPWDLKNVISSLVAEKECPKFTISFADTPLVGGKSSKIEIDFSKFEKIVILLRYFELLAFVLFLIKKTNDLLGRG